jgi:hypothetical protein
VSGPINENEKIGSGVSCSNCGDPIKGGAPIADDPQCEPCPRCGSIARTFHLQAAAFAIAGETATITVAPGLGMSGQLGVDRREVAKPDLARPPRTSPVSIIAGAPQFFLDLCLPPDRAEETRVALEDVYEKRWLPRHGHLGAWIICRVHVANAIFSHHAVRVTKLGGLILGMFGLKELSRRLGGS